MKIPSYIQTRAVSGFQFGNSLWLSDELNEFSAVGRDEMAGRGCQVLSLLEFLTVSCLLRLLSLTGLLPRLHRGLGETDCRFMGE